MNDPYIIAGEWQFEQIRKTLLRGTLSEWWSVIRGDIEERTARHMYLVSHGRL
jgi:hypothetical protein